MTAPREERPEPTLERFLDEPTRDLADWHWLWAGDRAFPVRSHRSVWGRLLVAVKRLLRPLVKTPQNDLWERQRVFNLILLERLQAEDARRQAERHEHRVRHLEAFMADGLQEVVRHDDALFARVDQKLDRYRREARELTTRLGASLARLEGASPASGGERNPDSGAPGAATELSRAWAERGYVELERRYRGTGEDIAGRIGAYLPDLENLGAGAAVLDLGCGRGEALQVFADAGLAPRGVDSSAEMVARCRRAGLEAEEGDLLEALAAVEEGSLAAVSSFHVIEHLDPASVDRLVRLAARALRPGGRLILETPNPLSVLVAARSFWLDPTHRRPVHPETLRLSAELAGFAEAELRFLRPYPEEKRLPELDLGSLPEEQHDLADGVNRLRDRLDELLFGHQDYALVARR